MFQIKRLFTPKQNTENNQYIPASSLIEEGSVLDRRKIYVDRRVSHSKIKPNWDRRKLRDRRRNKKIEGNLVDPKADNFVEILEAAYKSVVASLNKLSLVAEDEDYVAISELLDDFQDKIEAYLRKEEEILYLFINSVSRQSSKEKEEILSIFNKLIYQTGEEVLHSLEFFAGNISEINIEEFRQTIDKSLGLLADNYQQKQTHLYRIYNKVKGTVTTAN